MWVCRSTDPGLSVPLISVNASLWMTRSLPIDNGLRVVMLAQLDSEDGQGFMRAIAVAAFWMAMTLAAAAKPAPPVAPADVFRALGLFGTWAVDCGRPASPQNAYVSDFVDANGTVVEDHHLGAKYAVNHYRVLSAIRLSSTKVSLDVMFRPGDESGERQKLVMRVTDGHRRTLFNQPAGGEVRVKNGMVLGAGIATPTLVKCE